MEGSRLGLSENLCGGTERNKKFETYYILKLSTPCILVVNHFFVFQLNAHNILNTYIYYQLPPTCFGVCYTIFRETIALLAQQLYTFLQCCYNV